MKGQILVIIFIVLAVTSAKYIRRGQNEGEGQTEDGGKCYCDLYWTKKDHPNNNSVAFRIRELEANGVEGEGENLDCDRATKSCIEKCEELLQERFSAKNLTGGGSYALGKMLCEVEGVSIPYYTPRHINMKSVVKGCDNYTSKPMGNLCCFKCYENGKWQILYNSDCAAEPSFQMFLGEHCET